MDKSLLLEKTTKELSGVQNFPELATKAVRLIARELESHGLTAAMIFKTHPHEKKIYAYAHSSRIMKSVDKLLPKQIHELSVPLSATDNLIVRTVLTGQVQQSDDVSNFSHTVLSDSLANKVQSLLGGKLAISFPINSKASKPVGAILFMLASDKITASQLELLQMYANQLGLAFSNVFAFEKLLESYKKDMAKFENSADKEDVPSIKFTLRITPNENKRLEELASDQKSTKAEVMRSLIDEA